MREGKHGVRSAKQAIAIGLSKARRAGVSLPPPKAGSTSAATRKSAARGTAKGRSGKQTVSSRRSRATREALEHEGRSAASPTAFAKQAHSAAQRRGPKARSRAAQRAVRTKGAAGRSAAARKAARTRARAATK